MDSGTTEGAPEFPAAGSSGQASTSGYAVQARVNYRDPTVILGQLFDNRWRNVEHDFKERGGGVPAPRQWISDPAIFGLLEYEAAQALRWWLHAAAQAERIGGGLCLETRLVEHKIAVTYETSAVAAHDHIGGDGGARPSSFPPQGEQHG